ncbi:flagellar export protein FliJ [Desulforhopalus sp. 52FAK]
MAIEPKPFSLETVLSYRKRLEDLAKNRFFEATKVKEIIEEKLNQEKDTLYNTITECEKLQAEGIEIRKLILFEEKIVSAQTNIVAIEKNLDEKIKLVEQAQKNLITKSREYQVMKRLKYEQNAAWQQHLNKKEAAMLDEVAVMRHGKDPLNGQ